MVTNTTNDCMLECWLFSMSPCHPFDLVSFSLSPSFSSFIPDLSFSFPLWMSIGRMNSSGELQETELSENLCSFILQNQSRGLKSSHFPCEDPDNYMKKYSTRLGYISKILYTPQWSTHEGLLRVSLLEFIETGIRIAYCNMWALHLQSVGCPEQWNWLVSCSLLVCAVVGDKPLQQVSVLAI